MKRRKLTKANGIIGIVGGAFLFLASIIFKVLLYRKTNNYSMPSDDVLSVVVIGGAVIVTVIKISLIVLGIISRKYHKGMQAFNNASYILLIIGGAIGLIGRLGWLGGVFAIIAGIFYLHNLKRSDKLM
ncbi:hypothetical protein [Lactococcus allomyrinae]|uniref:Transporter n=1 Tax=Lactococcus allomyrinae TaxID=2419773 RepID=A0A387BBR8_9LACT|nr:hypothetical protein [Lactococcus allomyrinae]AYF99867.1 hypothetical protein D7I46_01470 [Lactococcus allomyrinae]